MSFPDPYIINPTSPHTHTIILLHGRGSYGSEFSSELSSLPTSQNKSLQSHFPSWRWVFPTSRERWSAVFEEDLSAWFDICSVADPSEGRWSSQVEGLRESVVYMLDVIVKREVEMLGGDSGRVFLGGMSQGMVTALWVALCSPMLGMGRFGGLLGFCGWIPFAGEIEDFLKKKKNQQMDVGNTECSTVTELLLGIIGQKEVQVSKDDVGRMLSTPVLLLHGSDDAWVDVELGRQAHRVLAQLGMRVDWNEYVGAENEGHWIKDPEGFDKIVSFLETALEVKRGVRQSPDEIYIFLWIDKYSMGSFVA